MFGIGWTGAAQVLVQFPLGTGLVGPDAYAAYDRKEALKILLRA